MLPLGWIEPLALTGEGYKLAFTSRLLTKVFQRPLDTVQPGGAPPPENLLPNPANVLGGQGADRGGYVDLGNNGHWWIPSGRVFYSSGSADTPAQELNYARLHFFLPHRYRDPFHTNAISTETLVRYDVYDLLMLETRDPLGNRVTVGERDAANNLVTQGNDYRVLQPRLLMDPNRNRTAVAFDALGMVVGTAVMGKPLLATVEGDSLAGFEADLTQAQIDGFYNAADPHAPAIPLLGNATTRIIYDLERFWRTQQANPSDSSQWLPPYAATVARETHVNAPLPPGSLKVQISFSYSDGFGREIQKKIQAEPEKTNGVVGSPRWVGSGWTIFNNKGKPVRQYEPFFSQLPIGQRHHFEFAAIVGVSPILFYDPVERVVATLHPNHTYEKVVFDPWQQVIYDVNDTVAAQGTETGDPRNDPDISGYVAEYFKTQPATWQTWYAQRQGGALGTQEQAAANKAAAHANTPTIAYFDTLGRPFLTVARNRVVCPNHDLNGTEEKFYTRVELDIEGNQRAVRDAITQAGDSQGRIVMRYDYDMLGNRIHQASMEAGERWMLNDVAGKPIRAWDSRSHNFTTTYDALRRPVGQYVLGTTAESDPRTLNPLSADGLLVDKIEYGESVANAEALNLRTRIYRHFDSVGVATNARLDTNGYPTEAYDFKGNLLHSTRRLVSDYKAIPDWLLNPTVEAEFFEGSTRYDALNRPIQSIAPRSNQAGVRRNVIQPRYNEANLLERVDVWLDHPNDPAGLLDRAAVQPSPVGVENIDYDAKGQRLRIDYKNGASTRYTYDPETFRLIHLYTRRGATFTDDCGNDPPPPRFAAPDDPPLNTLCGLQNLHYTYDPVGNITHIRDDAQQRIFFRNQIVEPSAEYTYDAIYRLIQATGREHLGQVGGAPIPHSYNDVPRVGIYWSANDGNAMGTYIERYVYDAVGNFLEMQHRGSNTAHPGWTRSYTYNEASQLEPGKQSNRLTSTTVGARTETYSTNGDGYDAHGSMLRMPQLQIMQWDYEDQLQMTQRQKVNDADAEGVARQGERTYYVYDAVGQRVRKVTELANGNLKDERIYLGSFEIYRHHSGLHAGLKRESLHIMDDKQRIALVETRNDVNDGTGKQLIRCQLGNYLDSVSLELDEQAQIVSYEEYTPYGSTSYQAVYGQTETSKRYRYTAKERDEESRFYYYGARYYAPWLGRWTSCDPAGLKDGANLYCFVENQPVNRLDPNGKSWKDFGKGLLVGAGTALVVAGAIALAPITIPASVATGLVVAGVGASGYTLVQSARERDVLNRPITPEQAHFQAGTVVGGLLVAAGSGPISSGMSSAANTAQESVAVLASSMSPLPAVGPFSVTAVTPVSVSASTPLASGLAVSMTSPMLMAAAGGGNSSNNNNPQSSNTKSSTTTPQEPNSTQSSQELNYTPNPNIRPHGQQPSPRPTGMQSHHPEQQTALSRNIANYDPNADPALLMSTPSHQATFAPQAAQRATGATFTSQLGTPAALEEAAQIMTQAGVNPATAGQVVMEHSGYLFSTTPANEVLMCLPP